MVANEYPPHHTETLVQKEFNMVKADVVLVDFLRGAVHLGVEDWVIPIPIPKNRQMYIGETVSLVCKGSVGSPDFIVMEVGR